MNFASGCRVDKCSPPPRLLKLRSSKIFIITTICIAIFTDTFLYGVLVPVMPFALLERAGVPEDEVQQWVSILLAVFGASNLVGSPIAGWYADNSSSRRLPLLLGLFALTGSTVLLYFAGSVGGLVAGRILQGLSAAVVWTVGIALLVDTVGEREIGHAAGYLSIAMSVGEFVSPLLGGIVYKKAGYYAPYYMIFGIISCDIFLRFSLIEKKIARQWMDELSFDDSTSKEAGEPEREDIAAKDSQRREERSDDIISPTYAAPEANGDLSIPEKMPWDLTQRETEAINPQRRKLPPLFGLLASGRILAALWGCIVQAIIITSFDSVLPLFVQNTFGWDSIGAGLIFLAILVPGFAAPIVGWIADCYGSRWLAVGGFLFATPFYILLRLVDYDSTNQKVLLCSLLALSGVGLCLVLPPLLAEITYAVAAKEKENPGVFGNSGAYAQAYGLFIMAYAAGTIIGPVLAGHVRVNRGWGTMTWMLGLFSATAAIPVLIWTGGLITRNSNKSREESGKTAPLNKENTEVQAFYV